MTHVKNQLDDELLMKLLKNILLNEDRAELARLRSKLNDPEYLSEKITPFVKNQLNFFEENFREDYKMVVNDIVSKRLQEGREEILEVLYPEMGKMIRKYITHQFQMLKENIENRIKSTFSKQSLLAQLQALFPWGRKAQAEEILSSLDVPQLEEMYIIQKDSGLLLGHASQSQSLDRDVVAGMLTAIKAFVEDAFLKSSEDLEMIEYGSYKILLQSFRSFYVAAAVSGSMSASEKEEMSEKILEFASAELRGSFKEVTSELIRELSGKIYKYFFEKPLET